MKITMKLSIALALAMVLSIVSLSVWAAPTRNIDGTVTNTAKNIQIGGVIPVTGGTYEVTLLENCKAKGEITRINYLEELEKEFGKAPASLEYLTDAVKIELDGACDIQICYPYPKEYEGKNGQIYKWDGKAWVLVVSTISSEDPKTICAIEKLVKGGIYDLIGNK